VSFTDAFFTSASALCVTGLTTVTTATTWTPMGVVGIAILIQIGGLGMTFVMTTMYLALGRKITLRDRILIAEDRNFGVRGAVRLMQSILYFSFSIEGTAALLFSLYFHVRYHYSWLRAVGVSVFHSVSAFNNAGFDLWGNSLESFPNDPFVVILTGLLIIFGGLGFIVLTEIFNYPRTKALSLHSKIVLRMTGILIVLGTLLVLLFEAHYSMQGLNWGSKVLNAWFASVTTRTAGFDSIPIGHMREATWFIMMILMFIGASPGSTGGGIKTTTLYVIIRASIATVRGETEMTVGQRSISWETSRRAMLIFFLASSVIATATLLDAVFEPAIGIMRLIFEEISAFGTVGLTTGITGDIHDAMKWVLICTMYIGRVGILTLLVGMLHRSRGPSKVKRVQERVFVG